VSLISLLGKHIFNRFRVFFPKLNFQNSPLLLPVVLFVLLLGFLFEVAFGVADDDDVLLAILLIGVFVVAVDDFLT
jgi:hypothetical protein